MFKRHSHQAFTLVEILVSMLILGLVSGLLLINLIPNSQTKLRDEAQRLQDVLTLASDFSRLSGLRLAWVWINEGSQKGYRFEVQQRNQRWQPFTSKNSLSESLNEHTLPPFIELNQLEIAGEKVDTKGARVLFHPSGINPIFNLTLGVQNQPTLTESMQSDPLGRVFSPEQQTSLPPLKLNLRALPKIANCVVVARI